MNESPDASEGKAYRQSPDGPDISDATSGRALRIFLAIVIVVGLAALAAAALLVVRHWHVPRWEAPVLAGAGVILAMLGAAGYLGGRNRSSYRFDSSSSRALSTLGRMHDKT